ncbi:MAG: choice-of-anchor V domain-containing protein [Ignavibacteria bacterium]
MKILKTFYVIIFIAFLFSIYDNLMAFRDGIVGLTKKNGNEIGCVCHSFKPNDSISVVISGPTHVAANDTAIYTLSIANGPAIAGGCDIAASLGNVYVSPLDTSLRRAESFPGSGFELTHIQPKLFSGDTLKFMFRYVAPSTPNITDTLFANGNSVNKDTTSDNDKWNYANNFAVTITPMSGINENNSIANSFELKQNYPNPFNPETRIDFDIRNSTRIDLQIFDISGKKIADLIKNKLYSAGNYSVTFNAAQFNLTSGAYFYKLSGEKFTEVKKMLLVK